MSKPPKDFITRLEKLVGSDNVLTDASDRWTYGYDNSRRHNPPDVVVFTRAHDQVLNIVLLCNAHKIPVVPRGRGTGTCGGAVPIRGGLVLSLERMDQILHLDAANRYMVVEPGVTNRAVQDHAATKNFFWPPDPTSADYCTVGGNLAFNAAGPRAVKYGTCRENILGLRAVTGGGEEIRTGVYTTKGVVGYDLTRLIVGSEGTLAIITEATLKLTPRPECLRTLRATYKNIGHATAAVVRIMSQPATPAALEFIDGKAITMVRDYAQVDFPQDAGAMLIIEVDGFATSIGDAIQAVTTAASGDGLIDLVTADTEADAAALWAARKALSPALRKMAPNKLNEDVVVPISRIPELIEGLDAISQQHDIPIINFGHAGNGNIHVNLLYDTQNPDQSRNARPCLEAVFNLVLTLDGTLSGEHGVGTEKQDYIGMEIDPVTLKLMRRIKQQFDPKNILNPGKMFPPL